jgi:hypothetical protein
MNENEIRFVDVYGQTLFAIPDGGNITLTYLDGEQTTPKCKYRNEHHAQIGSRMFHIDEFASRMARIGAVYAPEGETPDTYEIYQIADTGSVDYAFRSYEEAGDNFKRSDYVRQYAGMLSQYTSCARIYDYHNRRNRPLGQSMRSASMSDVFVLTRGGESRAFYIDTHGYQEVPQFIEDGLAMEYKPITPGVDEKHLFFRIDGEQAERHGAIGYLRGHFGGRGYEFHTSWFDNQRSLKSPAFKAEFDGVINTHREGALKDRREMEAFCSRNDSVFLLQDGGAQRGAGFKIQTQDYTYCFRCTPSSADYDFRVFAYDNRYLLPELAGQHELPEKCYCLTRRYEIANVTRGDSKITYYFPNRPREERREEVDNLNKNLGVTRQQEEAMLAGSAFGWDIPGAKPWKYNQDGTRRIPPKKEEPDRG